MTQTKGFSTKAKAMDYWHDSVPGRNDHARYVKESGRWFIEERCGWDWIRRDWNEYIQNKVPFVEVNAETAYGLTKPVGFAVRVF